MSMQTKKSAILAALAAVAVASSLLAVNILAGIPAVNPVVTGGSTSSTSTINPGSTTGTNGGTSTSTTSIGGGPVGSLSILLTDPPHVSAGVTSVYITYTNLAVHVSDAGNRSGWTIVKSQGTIDLMKTVNVSQTIASVKIAQGAYNGLRFNISSADVTFNGKNYTATVPHGYLNVPITDGIEVNSSKPSATIIDISPTVMNVGSSTNPEFLIRPAARALAVPSTEVNDQMEHEGFRMNLGDRPWFKVIAEKFSANLRITGAFLSTHGLNMTVKDVGNSSTTLRLVILSPITLGQVHPKEDQTPSGFFGAAIFVVEKNGTLAPIQKFLKLPPGPAPGVESDNRGQIVLAFGGQGFNLSKGASVTLTYSGPVQLGFSMGMLPVQTVVSGQQYILTVIGDESLASYVVVAS
jgi:hypothetical protein